MKFNSIKISSENHNIPIFLLYSNIFQNTYYTAFTSPFVFFPKLESENQIFKGALSEF